MAGLPCPGGDKGRVMRQGGTVNGSKRTDKDAHRQTTEYLHLFFLDGSVRIGGKVGTGSSNTEENHRKSNSRHRRRTISEDRRRRTGRYGKVR